MPYQPLPLPPTEPWSGLWDLDCEVELRGMMDGLLRQGHLLAVYRLGSDIQVGWRHQTSAYDVWGMPMLTPQAALRDATSRFFRSLKQGRNAVFSHPCIASSALAIAMTQQPLPAIIDSVSWQAMETSPKDGYPIQHVQLLMESGEIVKDAHWAHGGGEERPLFGPAWFTPRRREDGTVSYYNEVPGKPMKWAPMPEGGAN